MGLTNWFIVAILTLWTSPVDRVTATPSPGKGVNPFVIPGLPVFLDMAKKLKLSWRINKVTRNITFTVDFKGTGYVGIGLSKKGEMKGADIFFGGVKDGKPYGMDMHGIGEEMPVKDARQDGKILKATEEDGKTHLEITRRLNTGDKDDHIIDDKDTYIIWAFGASDKAEYHGPNRGRHAVNFKVK